MPDAPETFGSSENGVKTNRLPFMVTARTLSKEYVRTKVRVPILISMSNSLSAFRIALTVPSALAPLRNSTMSAAAHQPDDIKPAMQKTTAIVGPRGIKLLDLSMNREPGACPRLTVFCHKQGINSRSVGDELSPGVESHHKCRR